MAPLLDPVAGGALAARCSLGTRLLTHQRFGERLVFVHTGGIYGLFPAATQLAPLL